MNLRHASTVLALMGFLLTCSCSIDTVQQKQDYVENVELRLREVTVRIDELEYLHAESRESGMTDSPELAQTLDALTDKQQVAVKKLDEVRHAGVANWKGTRSSMDAALQDLERSCEAATFMLEEALLDMQESGMSRKHLLVSYPVVR
ncbi:MAG: hypothetical protein EHM61_16215 [Acidobacteria bacterium]|nr:MAG: hypothetical protein EHM61_16215 [Acidobacteriota bacterium]